MTIYSIIYSIYYSKIKHTINKNMLHRDTMLIDPIGTGLNKQ